MSWNPRVARHPQAERDIECQFDYYLLEVGSPDPAERFVVAIEETLQLLARNPELGPVRQFARSELAGVRSFPVKGFGKHLVFYRPTAEQGIEVLRVLHGARDLGAIFDE